MGLFEGRVVRKPFQYNWANEYVHAIYAGFWTSEEFNFIADKGQFQTALSKKDQDMVVRTLSAIGQVEIAVKTFWAKLGDHFPHPEISDLGFAMANSEVIHNMAYEKLLDVLGLQDAFQKNLDVPVIRDRVAYLRKHSEAVYKDEKKQYIKSIILFTLFVENASLFSQFYILMHLNKNKGILKDTAQQVLYTRNEEDLHRLIGIRLINTLRAEYPDLFDAGLEEYIYRETLKAIEAENKVIDWLLDGHEEKGLSSPILKAFIKKRMVDSLNMIGMKSPKINEGEKDLLRSTEWFDVGQHAVVMTDFFQQRPTEYSKHSRAFTVEDLFDE